MFIQNFCGLEYILDLTLQRQCQDLLQINRTPGWLFPPAYQELSLTRYRGDFGVYACMCLVM